MSGLSYYLPNVDWNSYRRSNSHNNRYIQTYRDIFTQIAPITDHLYLCSLNALTLKRLRHMGITQVISVMPESIPVDIISQVDRHIQIPVDDIDYSNLRAHFDEVGDRIAREARRGGKTVVHCMAGVSRSATIVLAYLMKHQGLNLWQAYNKVIAARPCIQPNIGFWRQLMAYEESLYGYRTMRINAEGFPEYAFSPPQLFGNKNRSRCCRSWPLRN